MLKYKEWPFLFQDEMSAAIIEELKIHTRRIITPHNSLFDGGPWPKSVDIEDLDWDNAWIDQSPSPAGNPGPYLHVPYPHQSGLPNMTTTHRIYPKYQPGDLMWVRETWNAYHWRMPDTDYEQLEWWRDYPRKRISFEEKMEMKWSPVFKVKDDHKRLFIPDHWQPSIYLPKKFARTWCEIGSIGCERIQDISYEDCIAETGSPKTHPSGKEPYHRDMHTVFAHLWDSINAKRGYSWESNPWVWIIQFKRV